MKLQAKARLAAKISDDLEYKDQATLSDYLEGQKLTSAEIKALLSKLTAVRTKGPFWRVMRSAKVIDKGTCQITFKRSLTSVSLTPHNALYAAISFAHDFDKQPRFLALYQFQQLDILADHKELKRLYPKSSHAYKRLVHEAELIAARGVYRGRCVGCVPFADLVKDDAKKITKQLGLL